MMRDIKVLQAALDNLVRRGMLPAQKLSLARAEAWVSALSLPPDQLAGWAKENRGYAIKPLTAIVMSLGVGAGSLKKKEQHELITMLQETAAQPLD